MSKTAEYSPRKGTPYSHIAHPISDNFSVLKVWLYLDFGQCLLSKYLKTDVLSQGKISRSHGDSAPTYLLNRLVVILGIEALCAAKLFG